MSRKNKIELIWWGIMGTIWVIAVLVAVAIFAASTD